MNKISAIVSFLSNKLEGAFSRESISKLVENDKISMVAAAESMSAIEAFDMSRVQSAESANSPVKVDQSDLEKMYGVDAVTKYLKSVKFGAMLSAIKEDDTLLYTEFQNIENARKRIASEIVAKEEKNFDMLLNEIKTTTGDPNSLLDSLIGMKCDISCTDC